MWIVPPVFARIAYGVKFTDGITGKAIPAEEPRLSGGEAQAAGRELLSMDMELRRLMFNTYNMGIGFVIALAPENAEKAVEFLDSRGFPAWEIGYVEEAQGMAAGLYFE
jgi:phosphoribosylformylglycinamidine cyclo-ligase